MAAASASAPYADAGESGNLGKYLWIPFAAGGLSIVVGLVALFYPGPTLLVVGFLFGGYLALWGTMTLIGAFTRGVSVMARLLFAIVGLLAVLAGLILMVRPGESVVTFVLVLGFWWTLSGVLQLVRGIVVAEGRAWNICWALVAIAAGVIILAQPEIGLVTLVWIVGIGLIVQGVIEIAAAFQLRKLHQEGVV